MVQPKAPSASPAEPSPQKRLEALPLVLEQQQSEPLILSLESQSDPSSPTSGRPLPIGQRALAEQPSPRESVAKRQAALVSLPEAEAPPLAWPLQEALPAEPEPLPLPSFA